MCFLAHYGGQIFENVVETEIGVLDVEFSGLDLREVENVIDDAEKGSSGAAHLYQVVALFRCQVGLEGEVRHADDCVHRRSDLVAHVGKEQRLRRCGFFGLLPGLDDLVLLLFPNCDITDRDSDLRVFRIPGRERAQPNLGRKHRAVLANSPQLPPTAQVALHRSAVEGCPKLRVVGSDILRDENLDRTTDEFVPCIPEDRLCFCIN